MKVISLGLGVQSTALYFMSSLGELPRCDYAIFSDTGKEKSETLKYLEFLLHWQKENDGVPIIVIRKKNLYTDLLKSENSTGQRFSSIPAFTKNEDGSVGMLRRQCTGEYKLQQVDLEIRNLYGKQPRQRLPQTEVWIGITSDEVSRVSAPKEQWKIKIFPFCTYAIDYKETVSRLDYSKIMSRNDVVNWYAENGLPVPTKSACVFCPYQSEESFSAMKKNQPEDFEAACLVDDAIRNSTEKKNFNQLFLHDSCKPLREIVFNDSNTIWKGECSGTCHT